MDFHELRLMTIAQLREIAAGLEGLTGYTQMRKAALLEAICRNQGIEMHEHHEVVGIDKSAVKKQIRALRVQRDAALEARDRTQLRKVLRQMHRLKGRLRRARV